MYTILESIQKLNARLHAMFEEIKVLRRQLRDQSTLTRIKIEKLESNLDQLRNEIRLQVIKH
jgi:uncharacterized protein Yka (UPF0111/DUF47 family)